MGGIDFRSIYHIIGDLHERNLLHIGKWHAQGISHVSIVQFIRDPGIVSFSEQRQRQRQQLLVITRPGHDVKLYPDPWTGQPWGW